MTDEAARNEALKFLNRLDDVNKVTIIQDHGKPTNIILADDMLMYVIHDCAAFDDVIDETEQKLREALSTLNDGYFDMPSCIYLFVMVVSQLIPNEYVVSLANVGVEDI